MWYVVYILVAMAFCVVVAFWGSARHRPAVREFKFGEVREWQD